MGVPDWADKVGDPRAYLSTFDDEFAFAIRDRGLKVQWAFPPDLARSARRNPGYTADPYELTLAPLAPVAPDAPVAPVAPVGPVVVVPPPGVPPAAAPGSYNLSR